MKETDRPGRIPRIGWARRAPLWLALCACAVPMDSGASETRLSIPYDSDTQVVMDGKIDDGWIWSRDPSQGGLEEIRGQLDYMLGQLNWYNSAPQTHYFQVTKGKVDPLDPSTRLYRLHYTAQGRVAWERSQGQPDSFDLILPARGDSTGLDAFTHEFLSTCTNNSEAADDSFFYYYYPLLQGCPLASPRPGEEKEVARFPISLTPSAKNTEGKYPEYGKVWEDGKLTATAVFGKYVMAGSDDSDPGVAAYDQFYSQLIQRFGQPTHSSASFQGNPGVAHPTLELEFQGEHGPILVSTYLVRAIQHEGQAFWSWYGTHTQTADLVLYNGHAGLGINVDALASQGRFTRGRYQIFMLNGCDTFAHLSSELFDRHGAANPGSAPSKYLDIIMNATSTYFPDMASDSVTLIGALDDQSLTYRDLLAQFASRQHALVDGEEDNNWPAPF